MSDLRQAAKAVVDRWDSPKWEWSQQGPTADLMAALRTALEQQAEPVAWTTMPEAEDWCFVSGGKNPTGKLEGKWFPLYTTPPQRKPLTEKEIEDIWVDTDVPILGATYIKLVRQIEAAHNIKEQP